MYFLYICICVCFIFFLEIFLSHTWLIIITLSTLKLEIMINRDPLSGTNEEISIRQRVERILNIYNCSVYISKEHWTLEI